MAKNKSTVYLGFEDEEVTAKHNSILNSTVNKVGGWPDWPGSEVKVPNCTLCGTVRSLIVQIYAPLEQSQFHRTLYIFSCLNPTCSQNSKSWICIRTQHLDTSNQSDPFISTPVATVGKKRTTKNNSAAQKITWCSGADDWGTDESIAGEEMDTEADSDNQQEENGNVIEKNDNSPTVPTSAGNRDDVIGLGDVEDDDEDESNSMENDLICGFGQLGTQTSPQATAEDPNANCAAGIAASAMGAGVVSVAGALASATFCAELEGGESDMVLVESPKKPERDLVALLKHTPNTAAIGSLANVTDVTLKSFFLAVDVETKHRENEFELYGGSLSADHIRDLYQDYKLKDETAISPNAAIGGASASGGEDHELYEEVLPAHGDVLFHQFVSTLQQNPGQILRYSRDTLPLLNALLNEPVPKCPNCNGETICEVQVLPTLIPRLQIQQNSEAAPIEYGNVLVFTCLKSCWDTPDKMRYERVIVQPEN